MNGFLWTCFLEVLQSLPEQTLFKLTTQCNRQLLLYPLPSPVLFGGVRSSCLWSTSQLLRPSGRCWRLCLALECCIMLYVCKGRYVFCLYCDEWICRYACVGSMNVLSCRCCIFVSCVPPVAVYNAAFCMTCSLLMLVEDARDDHMEEAYTRSCLITV